MDRINKFLAKRQQKHRKNIIYKNKTYTVTKDDLKQIRAYKSSKCLDSSIKTIPNRSLEFSSIPMEPLACKPKKDSSDYFNSKLKRYLLANPKVKVIKAPVNEIVDVWENENIDSLRNYTQEWIYSINQPYEGRVEDLKFNKEDLEQELKRVYMKHFKPRDPRSRPIRDILPHLPQVEEMRPFPELRANQWEFTGKPQLTGPILSSILDSRIIVSDLRFNKVIVDYSFDEAISRSFVAFSDSEELRILVSSNKKIYIFRDQKFVKIIETESTIKDIYISDSFIGYLTSKSIVLHDSGDYSEIKILKLKGDHPHKLRIVDGVIYASTHKGIMIESEEKTEVKHLGYTIDFVENKGFIYAINNLKRLVSVDKNLKIVGNTSQSSIGSSIRIHPIYNLLAINFADEICIYKINKEICVPINTIKGSYKSIDWDLDMPWLYACKKSKVLLFT